jgi:hypothetical protein
MQHCHLIWQSHVMLKCRNEFSNKIVLGLIELIHNHRDGKDITIEPIQVTISSLLEMNIHSETPRKLYEEEFERLFIQDTIDYYAKESSIEINRLGINEFVILATKRVAEEEGRNQILLPEFSHLKIKQACDQEYISQHLGPIIKEFSKQIEAEAIIGCDFSYRLVSRIPEGITEPLVIFENHVLHSLKEVVQTVSSLTQKDPVSFVDSLISLRERFIFFCQQSFQGDPAFEAALDKPFRAVLNDVQFNQFFQYAEGFSKYCDLLLKKGSKNTVSEHDAEMRIKQMISLLAYLDDKDVFQKFYARLLAKRLMYSNSLSIDTEMNIVTRLKELCGYEFTSKMQRMFTDITISEELNIKFQKSLSTINFDFNVMVLTTGSWPLPTDTYTKYRIPFEIEKGISEFQSFYLNKLGRVGRKLAWNHHLSRGNHNLVRRNPYRFFGQKI